jgi:pimeloyl-ACP methyl ester carboxylesterase
LSGSRTKSPHLKLAINNLKNALPHAEAVVFEGQEHNAMDTVPREFADAVLRFLLGR